MNVDLSLLDCRSVNGTAVTSGSNDSGDSDVNISKRSSEVLENESEDKCTAATALNPFILGPFDDEAPNGLFESSFSLSLMLSQIILLGLSYMIVLIIVHCTFYFLQFPNPLR